MSGSANQLDMGLDWREANALLERLPAMPVDERTAAVDCLVHAEFPEVRDSAIRVGAITFSSDEIESRIRDGSDMVLQNATLEILKKRAAAEEPLLRRLLGDEDPQVVIQALQVVDSQRLEGLRPEVRTCLSHEDQNVVQHAILAVGHLADENSEADLLRFLAEDNPWLQIGAIHALGDLGSAAAVPHLEALLEDSMLAAAAADALFQIGDGAAIRTLAEHCFRGEEDGLDDSLLALVVDGLERMRGTERLGADRERQLERFEKLLVSGAEEHIETAARGVLALGPGEMDQEALEVLLPESEPTMDRRSLHRGELLPPCLEDRSDLVVQLLRMPDRARCWGFILADREDPARFETDLQAAMLSAGTDLCVSCAAVPLMQLSSSSSIGILLRLLERMPDSTRIEVAGKLLDQQEKVFACLTDVDLPPRIEIFVRAILGDDPKRLQDDISELAPAARADLVRELGDKSEIVSGLPWADWLSENPEVVAGTLAEIALRSNDGEYLPLIHLALTKTHEPTLIRAVGELADVESIPLLLEMYETGSDLVRVSILESLGMLGGDAAQDLLFDVAQSGSGELARIATRSLSHCAGTQHLEYFHRMSTHPDWLFRVAAADALGSLPGSENEAALTRLAADPVRLVSDAARAALRNHEGS